MDRSRGSITPLIVALVFLMGMFVVVLARLGVATVTQAQARTAADAAALAGAVEGRDATGVRVMNLDAGDAVAAMAPVLQLEDAEAE